MSFPHVPVLNELNFKTHLLWKFATITWMFLQGLLSLIGHVGVASQQVGATTPILLCALKPASQHGELVC